MVRRWVTFVVRQSITKTKFALMKRRDFLRSGAAVAVAAVNINLIPVGGCEYQISFDNRRVVMASSPIEFPIRLDQLVSQIGKNQRESNKICNDVYTWDDIGLLAYCRSGQRLVHCLSIYTRNYSRESDYFPKSFHIGQITTPLIAISEDTTQDDLLDAGFKHGVGLSNYFDWYFSGKLALGVCVDSSKRVSRVGISWSQKGEWDGWRG